MQMTTGFYGRWVGAVSATAIGVLIVNGIARAESLEFHVPEVHDIDINAGELDREPKGIGRTAPPPDIVGVTKANVGPHEVPSSNLGRIKEGTPPPKPMVEHGPNGMPKDPGNVAPREAPGAGEAKAGEPRETQPRETEPNQASAGEESKGEGEKPPGKSDPKEKPSFYKRLAKNKNAIFMGAQIVIGVVLPVAIEAGQGSQSSQSNQ